jgi:hypothetical protein
MFLIHFARGADVESLPRRDFVTIPCLSCLGLSPNPSFVAAAAAATAAAAAAAGATATSILMKKKERKKKTCH